MFHPLSHIDALSSVFLFGKIGVLRIFSQSIRFIIILKHCVYLCVLQLSISPSPNIFLLYLMLRLFCFFLCVYLLNFYPVCFFGCSGCFCCCSWYSCNKLIEFIVSWHIIMMCKTPLISQSIWLAFQMSPDNWDEWN